jgi:hypothetical protein
MAELGHKTELSDRGRCFLLLETDLLHLFVRIIRIRPGASTAGAIGARDAAEPIVGFLKALEDSVQGHEFEIILVGSDTQMRGAGQGLIIGRLVRDEEVLMGLG